METINCIDPVLIINPKITDISLRASSYFIDGVEYRIDDEQRYRIASGDKPSQVLRLPYVKQLSGRSDAEMKRLDNFLDGSFFVDKDGVINYIWVRVPCGHCAACVSSKISSYVQRCQFALEQSKVPAYFTTLTFNPEHYPKEYNRRDIQLFQKKLKSALRNFKSYIIDHFIPDYDGSPDDIKFIYSGEVGHKGKFHIHCIIFGLPFIGKNSGHNFYLIKKLVQYAWRDAVRLPNGRYQDFVSYLRRYPKAFKQPKGYDPASKGYTQMSELKGSSAVLYALKYAFKHYDEHKLSLDECDYHYDKNVFVGASTLLGVSFVQSFREYLLNSNDSFLRYTSVINNQLNEVQLSKYYLDKLFPSESKLIPVEHRRAIVNVMQCCASVCSSSAPRYYKALALSYRLAAEVDFAPLAIEYYLIRHDKEHLRPDVFDYNATYIEDGLEFIYPVKREHSGIIEEWQYTFQLLEKSFFYLRDHPLDFDCINKQLLDRSKFFNRFKHRSFSEVCQSARKFEERRTEIQSKAIL